MMHLSFPYHLENAYFICSYKLLAYYPPYKRYINCIHAICSSIKSITIFIGMKIMLNAYIYMAHNDNPNRSLCDTTALYISYILFVFQNTSLHGIYNYQVTVTLFGFLQVPLLQQHFHHRQRCPPHQMSWLSTPSKDPQLGPTSRPLQTHHRGTQGAPTKTYIN